MSIPFSEIFILFSPRESIMNIVSLLIRDIQKISKQLFDNFIDIL